MRLTDHPEARVELLEATRFYKRSGAVLAGRFRDSINRGVAAIQERPERGRLLVSDIRSFRIDGFPYTISYRAVANGVKVFAYKHDRRRPGYWLDRLSD